MLKCFWLSVLGSAGVILSACGGGPQPPVQETGKAADGWEVTDWSGWKQQDTGPEARVKVVAELPEVKPAGGAVAVSDAAKKAGVLVLGPGEPFAVVRYEGKEPLPLDEYEISWEAARLEGNDFFAALTFPIGSADRCATLVAGGWGGWTVGVSSLDHQFANENATTGSMAFETGRWYAFTLQVNQGCLRALIDGKEQFKVGLKGRNLDMHPSEIRKSMPLGFASYQTQGAVRNLKVRRLKAGELVAPEGDF